MSINPIPHNILEQPFDFNEFDNQIYLEQPNNNNRNMLLQLVMYGAQDIYLTNTIIEQ